MPARHHTGYAHSILNGLQSILYRMAFSKYRTAFCVDRLCLHLIA